MSIEQKISNLIPSDKLIHFFYGFMIFQCLTIIMTESLSFWVVLGVAIAKELYDKFYKRTMFSVMDIVFTILAPAIIYIS
jgi:hypothetical protein